MIANLKKYDVVLTTSFEFTYGVCGHMFELAEYYWAIKNYTNWCPCILLADGTTIEEFTRAINEKYSDLVIENIMYCPRPKVIMARNLLVVDGSPRFRNADLFVDRLILFRCSESDFHSLKDKNTFLLQDNRIYDDKPDGVKVIDYTKKILFDKFKYFSQVKTHTAMFYLTDLCRIMPQKELEDTIKKYGFKKNIILTNRPNTYDLENVFQVPVDQLWSRFDTYIYTRIPRQRDCSNRFVLECLYYGKDVIFDIDYYDRALEIRKQDGIIRTSLTKDDYLFEFLNE